MKQGEQRQGGVDERAEENVGDELMDTEDWYLWQDEGGEG